MDTSKADPPTRSELPSLGLFSLDASLRCTQILSLTGRVCRTALPARGAFKTDAERAKRVPDGGWTGSLAERGCSRVPPGGWRLAGGRDVQTQSSRRKGSGGWIGGWIGGGIGGWIGAEACARKGRAVTLRDFVLKGSTSSEYTPLCRLESGFILDMLCCVESFSCAVNGKVSALGWLLFLRIGLDLAGGVLAREGGGRGRAEPRGGPASCPGRRRAA